METLRKLSSMGRSTESTEAARLAVGSVSKPESANGGAPDTEDNVRDESLLGPSPPRAPVTDETEDDDIEGDEEEESAVGTDDEGEQFEDVEDDNEDNQEEEAQPQPVVAEKFQAVDTEQLQSEEDELSQATSSLAKPESDVTELKEDVASEVVPIAASSEPANESTESKYVVKRAASNDLMAELEKLAASRLENESTSGEAEPAVVTESASEERSQSISEREEEPAVSEPVGPSPPRAPVTDDTEDLDTEEDEEEESAVSEPAAPSPPRAPVTDDTEDEAEEVEEEKEVEDEKQEVEAQPQAVEAEKSQAVGIEQVQSEEPELSEATSSLAEPEPDNTGVKEEVAPEVVPLATAEVGALLKEGESEESEQSTASSKMDIEARECSSDLAEELQKLSASRSHSEEGEISTSGEAEPAIATESSSEEPSQGTAEKEEEPAASEPANVATVSKYVVKRAASNDLMAELEKLAAARLENESRNATVTASTSDVAGESSPEKEQDFVSIESSAPKENVVDAGESAASEVQSVLTTDSEQVITDSTPSNAEVHVEIFFSDVAEVRNVEEGKEEEKDSPAVRDELPKEVVEDSAVVPSPAKLYTALKAVDDELPPLKSENGNVPETEEIAENEKIAENERIVETEKIAENEKIVETEKVAETEEVQSRPRGFSAVDFTGEDGDSDADAEDEDDENDEDDEDDDEDEDETDMDTAKALAELANAVVKSGNGSESGTKPSMGAAGPSLPTLPQRPVARKTAVATALDTAGRITQRPNGAPSTQLATTTDENANGDTAEGNETREKLQNIRVKFLRLAHRLGQSPQNVVVAQVLYRLGLAESLRGGSTPNRTGAFSFDRANALAEEQEAANQEEELDFACTILVLGKTGVGKSATINSIFDERKSVTSAFKPSTNKVQEIVGTVHGIKVRVIDTPGLLPSVADQQHNERIMGQVKKHIKKASPDIVLYFDRLDMQSRDYGDLPLLRTITDLFGAAVWFNAIVVLTHASSAPPDGPNGVPLSYEMFVAQRSHVVQQTIRQAAGDMRLMNPVSLVENHPACRTNRTGQRVLPNGQIWKPQLLLLCFASKILAEANSLLKLQETATPGRPFGQRSRVPPLPFLLSSLLQSRAQLKLPDEQLGESDESDDDEEEEDSDADDYDELPPFRPLSKEELEELSKEQRQDYMDELADRERLFQKKQYREEMRRRKEMKKRAAQMSKEELAQPGDEADDEAGKAAAVPVPMPDMALPPSFDSDNPTHRYRYLETANQWLVRPVLETHGWDHDAGYDGFNVEKMFVVKDKIPASVSGQVTKDKKEAQVNFEAAASLKHGEGKVTLTGFDIQTIGKDLAYTLRAETRFNNFKRNKTTAGLTATYLNDTIAAGLKLEDRILIGKRVKMVVNGGVMTGKGDKAFGGSLEATLRGKEYPLSRTLSTLGLSVMDWHGDLAIGGNLQSQFMVGKTMMVGRANLNNRGSGQVSIRASSSEQLQMVLIGIVPILRSLINCRFGFGQPSQ